MFNVRVVAVLLVAALVAGCSSSDAPSGSPGPSGTPTTEPGPGRTIAPRPATLVGTGRPARLRVLQYNIQYADAGIDGVARDIRAADPDIVLLNEIDDRRPTGGLLQAAYLAERLGMSFAYDPNGTVRDGIRGNAVLTRLDIAYVRRFRLPAPDGTEKRGLMNVVVTDGRLQLDVWTTHLDPDGGTTAQARRVSRIIGTPSCSTILGGDLNRRSDLQPPTLIRRHLDDLWAARGDGFGGTNRAGDRRIDYLFYRDVEPVSAVVLPRDHSDHRRLVGTFLVDPRRNC